MDFLELLKHSYTYYKETMDSNESKLAWVGEHIFDFTTYDDSMSELFAVKALEVCEAISKRTTFKYIADPQNQRWYLLLLNTSFFPEKTNWGTSIRGAWWDAPINRGRGEDVYVIDTCGVFDTNNKQLCPFKVKREDWEAFVQALFDFTAEEVKDFQQLDQTL